MRGVWAFRHNENSMAAWGFYSWGSFIFKFGFTYDNFLWSYLVYPSVFSLTKFPVKIGQVPPIINPKVAGPELFNTEHLKNSHVLKNVKSIQGSQNKLVELLVAGEVNLGTLDSMSHEDLKTLCHQLNFQSISRYNNSARSCIFTVYVTILLTIYWGLKNKKIWGNLASMVYFHVGGSTVKQFLASRVSEKLQKKP